MKEREKPAIGMTSEERARICAEQAGEYKAQDIVLLDVSGFASFADHFVICSGKSSRQVQGIADNMERGLRTKGIKPLGIEGRGGGHWILMDYGDVIVHVFYEPVRHLYDLESLWSEARKVRLEHVAEPDETGLGGAGREGE